MSEQKDSTFLDHLKALRSSLKKVAISILIGFLICYGFAEDIFLILRKQIDRFYPQNNINIDEKITILINKLNPHLSKDDFLIVFNQFKEIFSLNLTKTSLYYQTPFEPFIVYFKVALMSGLFISFPFVLYFLWQFFEPALYKREKKIVLSIIISGSFLFIGGALIGYYLIFPYIVEFAMSYIKDGITPILTMDSYFSIFAKMLLGFGVIFELPLVLIFLSFIGFVSAKGLLKFFRYAVVIIFFVSAVLTPPDVLSQFLMAMPLVLLYGISIIIVWFLEKSKKNKEKI